MPPPPLPPVQLLLPPSDPPLFVDNLKQFIGSCVDPGHEAVGARMSKDVASSDPEIPPIAYSLCKAGA